MAERKPLVISPAGLQMELPLGDTLPLNALPTSLANFGALAGANNQVPYFTGTNTYALTALTVYGRELIGAADNAAARAVLSLGTSATRDATTSATDTTSERLWRTNDLVKVTSDSDTTSGSVLTVGYGGLGSSSGLNVDDCNTLAINAFYRLAAAASNAFPGKLSGDSLLHCAFNTSYGMQIGGGRTNRFWLRYQNNGSWNPWVEIWHSGNFDPATKADVTYVDNQIATRVELRSSGERIRLPSAGPSIGNFISFYGESGRRGYIGFGSGANDILTISSDTAATRLMYAGAQRLITNDLGIAVSGQITLATPATGDNSTRAPTTAWTNAAIAAAIAATPAAALDYTQMAKSGSAGPNGFLRTAQGATYSFVPLWEEAKALAGDRYVGQMRCVSSGTTGAGTSAAIGTDYITMVTGSSASGGCAVYVDEGSYSIQRVFKPYPDSPVTNIKSLWFNGVFRMPSALSSSGQRYTLDMGINGNYGSVTNGGITIRYSDNLNSGRPVVIYQNAAGSTVTTNTALSVAANDVIQVALAITRDASNVATVGILIANLTQGQIVNVSLTGTQTIYNSADAFPPNVAQAKMQFSIQKSTGTTSISAQLLGMTTGFNWITPLADWL